MSLENRYDRWVMERDGNNKTNGKTYEEYKEALMNTTNNWFTSEKGVYYFYHYFMTSVLKPESVATTPVYFRVILYFRLILSYQTFLIINHLVVHKWLEGALRELDDGKYKSQVHPFIRQWGTGIGYYKLKSIIKRSGGEQLTV